MHAPEACAEPTCRFRHIGTCTPARGAAPRSADNGIHVAFAGRRPCRSYGQSIIYCADTARHPDGHWPMRAGPDAGHARHPTRTPATSDVVAAESALGLGGLTMATAMLHPSRVCHLAGANTELLYTKVLATKTTIRESHVFVWICHILMT